MTMRTLDKVIRLNRRRFLQQSAGAAVLVGAISGSGTFAATLKTLEPASGATLVRMARDLYPHDRLPDFCYENAVATIDGDLAKDAATHSMLSDGVASLDAAAKSVHGKPYAALESEADRVAILERIEGTSFFTTFRSAMTTALYNQPDVWTKLGYEGPSAEHGGYLHRGFNDLDWLPA
jgi:hypothetical protein